MSDVAATAPGQAESPRPGLGALVQASEINLRLFGMVLALAAILGGFALVTGGRILEPANLVTLAVQTASVAIIATGMVLVIVSRNIDLSVGSIVGVCAMAYALLMARILPEILGFEHPLMWVVALALGLGLGGLIGAVQGFIVAYVGVPSFVVTLGGLLALRGVVWVMSSGASVSGLDPTFRRLGGGPLGSIGGLASWIVGLVLCVGIVALLAYNRRRRRKFGFPLRPMWAEVLLATLASATTLGLVYIANSYLWPDALANQFAAENDIPIPAGGLRIPAGIPWPLLVLVAVTIIMTFIATRRRFGRYVYAIGGNPEAAELAGINTRWTVMKTFMLIGVLCGLSGAVAAARLNGATLDVGLSYELYVIAAAVVGGTSLAGGIGTISGAVLGALVMQSLAYGLSFMGLSSPVQNIAAGTVLIVAVGFDSWNRRRGT